MSAKLNVHQLSKSNHRSNLRSVQLRALENLIFLAYFFPAVHDICLEHNILAVLTDVYYDAWACRSKQDSDILLASSRKALVNVQMTLRDLSDISNSTGKKSKNMSALPLSPIEVQPLHKAQEHLDGEKPRDLRRRLISPAT